MCFTNGLPSHPATDGIVDSHVKGKTLPLSISYNCLFTVLFVCLKTTVFSAEHTMLQFNLGLTDCDLKPLGAVIPKLVYLTSLDIGALACLQQPGMPRQVN